MKIVQVLIEYKIRSLDRPFSYGLKEDQSVSVGCRVKVKFNNSTLIGFVVGVSDNIEKEKYEEKNKFQLNYVEEVIDTIPLISEELFELAQEISKYYYAPLISVLNCILPPSLKASSSYKNHSKIKYIEYVEVNNFIDQSFLNSNEKRLVEIIKEKKWKKTEIGHKICLNNLINKGVVRIIKEECYRLEEVTNSNIEKPKVLTLDQQKAYETILHSNDKVFLLQGVTGSGKTEVYYHLIDDVIKEGRDAIILVPEISLTLSMVKGLKARFKENVSVVHSGLTDAVKYDEYRRIMNGQAHIVVGARSAVFAPLKHLKLIIIDEEHVDSYKQDSLPFYSAKQVAIMRLNKIDDGYLLLGSATPSIESKARASKGIYKLVKLDKRINDLPLPLVEIVDLGNSNNIDEQSIIISRQLRHAIKNTLDKKEQSMLLINRRGFSKIYRCAECGTIVKCPNCDIPLTYHKEDNSLRCHHCDYYVKPHECEHCHSMNFEKIGYGTEKVMDEINKLFPTARVIRLDKDTGKNKNAIYQIIEDFKAGKYDIMVGTQMIAKGLDFANVTLSALVLGDIPLNIPSYKSVEDTFDLVYQLSGRAGRGEKVGQTILQTYLPENTVFKYAMLQDYDSFYNYEMNNRKNSKYPPYVFVMVMTITGKDLEKVKKTSMALRSYLIGKFMGLRVDIIGPIIPYIQKINNRISRKIMIKYKSKLDIDEAIQQFSNVIAINNDVNIVIDVDSIEDC